MHKCYCVSVVIPIILSFRRYLRLSHAGNSSLALHIGINNIVGLCLRGQVTSVVCVYVGLLGCV
jgi:hypothetical protein